MVNGSALAPIGYAGVRHDNAFETLGQHKVLTVNGIAYLVLKGTGSGITDFVLLEVVVFEVVVDVDGLRVVVGVLVVLVDVICVVAGALLVVIILRFSTSPKASGRG